jgi:hypothetical protein
MKNAFVFLMTVCCVCVAVRSFNAERVIDVLPAKALEQNSSSTKACSPPATGNDVLAGMPPQSYPQNHKRCTPYPLDPSVTSPRVHAGQYHSDIMRVPVSELTPATFLSRFVIPRRPVIIQGAAANLFHGTEDDGIWSVGGLERAKHANEKLPIKQGDVGYSLDGVGNPNSPLQLDVAEVFQQTNRTVVFMKEKISALQAPVSSARNSLFSELFSTYRERNNIASDFTEAILSLANQAGATPHAHGAVVNVLFQGAKRWIISDLKPHLFPNGVYDPTVEGGMKRLWLGHGQNAHDWFKEHASRDDGYYNATLLDFVQQEGEVLFLPDLFLHATVDICREAVSVILTWGSV